MNRIHTLVATMFNSKKKDKKSDKPIFSYLHFCTEHTGKMSGMYSLSTSPKCNPHCEERAKIKGSICEKCYSQKMHKNYKDLAKWTKHNSEC